MRVSSHRVLSISGGRARLAAVALAAASTTCGAVCADECQPAWVPFGGTGMNQVVQAMVLFDDGSGAGEQLYAGGRFTSAGGVAASGVARWDGAEWHPLGSGLTGDGPVFGVRALAVFDDGQGGGPALYAGGQFSFADGVPAEGIARWNGSEWTPVGSGQMTPVNATVNALMVFDDGTGGGPALFAGGGFTSIGGVTASRIAKWNGTQWIPLGAGTSSAVYAMAAYDDGTGGGPMLHAAGVFTMAGGAPVNFVAKWSGASWSSLGGGMGSGVLGVWSLAVFDDGTGEGPCLFAGGDFGSAGGVAAPRLAKWNGASWSAAGTGLVGGGSGVYALSVWDDGSGTGPALYAGGWFTSVNGVPPGGVAKRTDGTWSALGGSGTDLGVFSLLPVGAGAAGGPALYVGGGFQMAGGLPARAIAQWRGCAPPPCAAADITCDGVVNGADLGALLSQWGRCAGCAADVNGDGVVDGADLGALLSAWTP